MVLSKDVHGKCIMRIIRSINFISKDTCNVSMYITMCYSELFHPIEYSSLLFFLCNVYSERESPFLDLIQ